MLPQTRLCAQLIDKADVEICNNQPKERCVISKEKPSVSNKPVLLETLRKTFIEPVTHAIREDRLRAFCHDYGIELVSYNWVPNVRSEFKLKLADFDIEVSSC